MCKGYSESFKHAVIQFLKVLVECEAPQLVDYIESLSQTRPEQGEVPEEAVRGAGVRPCPHSAAEEAHSQEGEEVKVSVETASSHEAEEEQDVGEVEQRSLRSLFPFTTERERWRGRLHCQVHGFKVRRLHSGGSEERSSANTELAPTRRTCGCALPAWLSNFFPCPNTAGPCAAVLHLTLFALCSSFKTLGDMSKETKIKRKSRALLCPFSSTAPKTDLSRYFKRDLMLGGDSVDGDIVMLSAHWERRKAALTHLQEQLQSLPDFITELDAITANIAQLEGEFAEMESRLLHLETLCCQCEQQTVKNHHMSQLEEYKKKKRKEADLLEAELKCEHAQRVAQMELVMQQKLRERQKVYEEAFNQDVEKYLSTGCLQGKESAGVDVAVLDQMTFINVSDLEALDDFLNSTGEDSSCGSSLTSGPDLNSSSLESLNQAPPINSSQSDQAAERQQEEPLVQSDEEDVQADMSLAAVQDVGTAWDSDESDGADPLMEKAQN
ncbi:hypothetical protein CCH79_00018803, partial [Gambusia affinis]